VGTNTILSLFSRRQYWLALAAPFAAGLLLLGGCGDDDDNDNDPDDELSAPEDDGSTGNAGESGQERDSGASSSLTDDDDAGQAGLDAGTDGAIQPECDGDDCAPMLTALGVSAGRLEPALNADDTAYALAVGLTTPRITLTPTGSPGSTIEINGERVDSGEDWQSGVLDLGDTEITITVAAQDHPDRVYTLTVTRTISTAFLKANNAQADDALGYVAISGDTLVAGAPGEDSDATTVDGDGSNNGAIDSGAAYVFVRDGANWSQQAYLKAPNAGEDDGFGSSVAIDGDFIVVGASGEDSDATEIDGDGSNDGAIDSGAAYVFARDGNAWSLRAYLKASNAGAGDGFGNSVAISGRTVVVGAALEDSDATEVDGDGSNDGAIDSGAAYVFARAGGTWTQQAYLKAGNSGAGDVFGDSVAISEDTIAVGASLEDSNAVGVDGDSGNDAAVDSGAAYLFSRSGTTWSAAAYVKAGNTGAFDVFGISVALSGDTLVVGASLEDSDATSVDGDGANDAAVDSGAAYVYRRARNTWAQQAYLKASNANAGDTFGYSVAISGHAIVVGARLEDGSATGVDGDDDDAAPESGAAYVFLRAGRNWSQLAYLKASNTGSSDGFGETVAISEGTIAVGAPGEDATAPGTENEGGAVYVYW
jgi:hypothetical protein